MTGIVAGVWISLIRSNGKDGTVLGEGDALFSITSPIVSSLACESPDFLPVVSGCCIIG